MNRNDCDKLDDFLLGELSEADQQLFGQHLVGCEDCQQAAALQDELDGMIQQAAIELGHPQVERRLAGQIGSSIQRREKNRQIQSAIMILTAASVLIVCTWTWLRSRTLEQGHQRIAEQEQIDETGKAGQAIGSVAVARRKAPAPEEAPAETVAPKVSVRFPKGVVAVPVESGHDDITLIEVFPTTLTTVRPR